MRPRDSATGMWLGALALAAIAVGTVAGYGALRWMRERASRPTLPVATQDKHPSPDEAYRELWRALARRDAAAASRYVPAAQLGSLKSDREVVDHFLGLPVGQVQVDKATTRGDRAVLFVRASSPDITDGQGRPSPIDVVVRMEREAGRWKVDSQMWLVATPPAAEQQRALAWLKEGQPR